MTIQELYIFACKNDLYNKDVYEVINKFNKLNTQSTPSSFNSSIEIDDELSPIAFFNKLEWSTSDVLELFST